MTGTRNTADVIVTVANIAAGTHGASPRLSTVKTGMARLVKSLQKIENPAMPGMKVDLTQMTGKGTSERTLDLGKLLPSAGTSDLHSEAAMALDMGGQKQAISTKTDLNVRLEAK